MDFIAEPDERGSFVRTINKNEQRENIGALGKMIESQRRTMISIGFNRVSLTVVPFLLVIYGLRRFGIPGWHKTRGWRSICGHSTPDASQGCCHRRWLCPFCHWNLMIHRPVGAGYINICLVIPSWIHLPPRQRNPHCSDFYITPFRFIAALVSDALRSAF